MDQVWITLITTLGAILGTLIGYLVWYKKRVKTQTLERDKKEEEERQRQKAKDEIANFTFGQVSLLLNENIKVVPDLKKEFNESYERYRSLDLVKANKETSNSKKGDLKYENCL